MRESPVDFRRQGSVPGGHRWACTPPGELHPKPWQAPALGGGRLQSSYQHVLHAFWADEPGWLAAWIGRKLRVPVIISIAGGELVSLPAIGYGTLRHPGRGALTSWGFGTAAAVSAGSRYLLDLAYHRLRPRDRTKLALAPLGVDTTRFAPVSPFSSPAARGLRPPLVYLNVGSLHPVKGQAVLIRAFARAVKPRAVLRMVGEGPLREDLKRLASVQGVAERVAGGRAGERRQSWTCLQLG